MSHLSKNDYEVRACSISLARELVERYHYAQGAANTATVLHGLYRIADGALIGVAWWMPPTKGAAQTVSEDWQTVLTLSRLVIVPEAPTNSASFLLGASIKLIKRAGIWQTLLTYADTFRGHTGAIYKATNWQYVGKTQAYERWETPTGRQVSRKAGPKTRTYAEMRELGYKFVGMFPKHKYVIHLPKRVRQNHQLEQPALWS